MQFWSHDTKISRTTKFHCGNTRARHETLKHIAGEEEESPASCS
jgi:hypothetical protein